MLVTGVVYRLPIVFAHPAVHTARLPVTGFPIAPSAVFLAVAHRNDDRQLPSEGGRLAAGTDLGRQLQLLTVDATRV